MCILGQVPTFENIPEEHENVDYVNLNEGKLGEGYHCVMFDLQWHTIEVKHVNISQILRALVGGVIMMHGSSTFCQ